MRNFHLKAIGAGLALVATVSLAGCGSGGPTMGRVSGTVSYQNKPIAKGKHGRNGSSSMLQHLSGSMPFVRNRGNE